MVVEGADLAVETLVEVLLPDLAGGVAEEDAAAHGADGVDGTEALDLKGAAGPIGGGDGGGLGGVGQRVDEKRQLEGGDEEEMAVGVEAAAGAGLIADWAALGDLIGEVGVEGGEVGESVVGGRLAREAPDGFSEEDGVGFGEAEHAGVFYLPCK